MKIKLLIITFLFMTDLTLHAALPDSFRKALGIISNSIIVTDFQDELPIEKIINYWSLIYYKIVPAPEWTNMKAFRLTGDVKGYCCIILNYEILDKGVLDWRGMRTLNLMIYGAKDNYVFYIGLIDQENEYFQFMVVDNWRGWKKISIPIDKFRSRMDWQQPNAHINRKIDYPLKEFRLDLFWAMPELYFGPIWASSRQ